MSWFLEYSDEEGKHRVRLDEGSPLKIGRGSSSDTKISDPVLSRLHCEVSVSGATPVVRDLESSAGTFVGREKIAERELSSGQMFQAGNTHFRVVSDSPLDAPTLSKLPEECPKATLDKCFAERGSIDRFKIVKLMNKSGRSLLYKAIDPDSDDMEVAVKVIPTAGEATEEEEARFMRAMKTLREVRDPYIVKLLRAGRKSNYCWVAMEWLEEGSVADRVQKLGVNNSLEWRDAWRVTQCIAQSLHVLEQAGLVHRSISPSNILYRSNEQTWVLSDLVNAKTEQLSGSQMVTRQFFLPQNLEYTAPERLRGFEANQHSLQADIYSLGAVLTEMLIGEPPYGRGTLPEILSRLDKPRLKVDGNKFLGINELFVDLVNRMTEPQPEKRFASAAELWRDADRVGKLSGLSSD